MGILKKHNFDSVRIFVPNVGIIIFGKKYIRVMYSQTNYTFSNLFFST